MNGLKLSRKSVLRWFILALTSVSMLVLAATASAATSVYAEGAYNESTVVVYVYADITDDAPLVSQCVKVTYDPAKLQVASADKNEDVWYFGETGNKYPYKDPEDDGSSVVILGGKLDTANPTEGVSGSRVLLGTITFNRVSGAGDPDDPLAPENFFGISLGLGKGGNFSNFVDTAGNVQDDPSLFTGITIREFGDANADGNISAADYIATRNLINSTDFPPYADCNNDGAVSAADYICVRNKI